MRSPSLAAARAAEVLAASHRETPADKERRMEELEERARLYGDSVKQSAAAKALEKKWVRFVLVHGVQYGFKESQGPSVKLVEHFVTYCFCMRDRASVVGREGLGWLRRWLGQWWLLGWWLRRWLRWWRLLGRWLRRWLRRCWLLGR